MQVIIATLAHIAGTELAGVMLVVMKIDYLYVGSMVTYASILFTTFALRFYEENNDRMKDKRSSSCITCS